MQIKQLEYLLKIVECGSITQAARQLYISQPSLTKAINNLENEYGVQLLTRTSRGVDLTVEGKNFVHYARGVINAASALEQTFRGPQEDTRSRLFISCQQLDFVYELLLKTLEENRHKHIHYNLVEADRSDIIRQVINGEVDLGLVVRSRIDNKTFLWQNDTKRLDFYTLDEAGIYICVGPKSPHFGRDKITADEANRSLHLMLDMESRMKRYLYIEPHLHYLQPERTLFFNTYSACEYFLKETDALLYLPKWTTKRFQEQGFHIMEVVPPAGTESLWHSDLLLIKRVGEPLNQTERQFVRHLYDYFGKTAPFDL